MRKRGRYYESLACKFLEERDYKIIEKNFKCSRYEIDIVALDGDTLVFVEVKGAKNTEFGHPALKVDGAKLRRIKECASEYLSKTKHPFRGCRIDVVAIIGEEIEHIKGVPLF